MEAGNEFPMKIQDYKKLLLSRRAELNDLIDIADDNKASVMLDQTKVGRLSRMDAIQSQAMSQEVERRRNAELSRITAALERIIEDEFGYCITCGNKIKPQRLELDPSVPQCSKCAKGQA